MASIRGIAIKIAFATLKATCSSPSDMPALIAVVVVVALAIAAFHKLEDLTGMTGERLGLALIMFIVIFAIGAIWLSVAEAAKARREAAQALAERRRQLAARFGLDSADRILAGQLWTGMTAEQLRESLGSPSDVDHQLTKRLRREIWKYGQTGVNRFKLRITLDDEIVTGWEKKGT